VRPELEQVLRNWLRQAISQTGRFENGIDPAAWVAQNFISWFDSKVEDSLSDAELAASRLRDQLKHLGYPELDEALHELTHVQDALGDLRSNVGLSKDRR
jgi:hypothetical protein